MNTEKNIAKHLLDIKAVFLKPNDPFTWASGIKAPIYCDNRLTLSYPEVRDDVEHAIAEIIKTHYPECEAVMGTSTAGIAHAALVAMSVPVPKIMAGPIRLKAAANRERKLLSLKI